MTQEELREVVATVLSNPALFTTNADEMAANVVAAIWPLVISDEEDDESTIGRDISAALLADELTPSPPAEPTNTFHRGRW